MVHIEINHTFPVSVSGAFAYITDMSNWAEYWPDFVRIQDPSNARWGNPGDEVTIVLKLINRERELNMKLEEFQTDALVTYVSHQQGLPEARHERHFREVPGGFQYRAVVAYEPRKGFTGLFDRLLVKRAVERALRQTIENLEGLFKQQR